MFSPGVVTCGEKVELGLCEYLFVSQVWIKKESVFEIESKGDYSKNKNETSDKKERERPKRNIRSRDGCCNIR